MGKFFAEPRGSSCHEPSVHSQQKNLLCSGSQTQLPVPKCAFSCTDRSKKVRDPRLRATGTECLQASQCTLLLPEVSGGGGLRSHSSGLSWPICLSSARPARGRLAWAESTLPGSGRPGEPRAPPACVGDRDRGAGFPQTSGVFKPGLCKATFVAPQPLFFRV